MPPTRRLWWKDSTIFVTTRPRGDPSLSSLMGISGLLCSERSSLGADTLREFLGRRASRRLMPSEVAKFLSQLRWATHWLTRQRVWLIKPQSPNTEQGCSRTLPRSNKLRSNSWRRRRIIRVTTHTRACRQVVEEQRAKSDAGRFVLTPAVPMFACMADSVTLRLVDPPPLSGESQQQHSQLRLRIFWTTLYVCPISDPCTEHGITWLQ